MDSDTLGDSDYEPAESETSFVTAENEEALPPNIQFESVVTSSRSSPIKDNVSTKWNRLRRQHNPKYIEVFNKAWQTSGYIDPKETLEPSHLGAVSWTRQEKLTFFEVVAKCGRHDLARLSQAIGTKSEVEIKAYLEAIQQTLNEMNASGLRRHDVSLPEMSAAIEIGQEMETELEIAADALSAYQEQYDYALGHRQYNESFIVDKKIAETLDAESDARQNEDNGEDGDDSPRPKTTPADLFRLSTFCDLSGKFFMRGTGERPFDNWMSIAEDGESPAMTQDFVKDFHTIAVSLVQRLVQTAIFIAKSRLRATTSRNWNPSHTILQEDVNAALQILNLEKSLWDYWVLLPERLGLRVVSGHRVKRDAKEQPLDTEYVRDRLLQPTRRGRHSRSPSKAGSSAESDLGESGAQETAGDNSADSGDDELYEPSEEERESSNPVSDAEGSEEEQPPSVPASVRRSVLDEEDKLAETLDQQCRQAEEQRLARQLGLGSFVSVKSDPDERPTKRLRRVRDEPNEWHAPYLAAWEIYDLASDGSESLQTSRENP
jgi:RNA polymerase I-specific transcription initiation factor RRN5